MAPRTTQGKNTQQPRDHPCPICGEPFTQSGLWRHERVCAAGNVSSDRADMAEAAAMVDNGASSVHPYVLYPHIPSVLRNGRYMPSILSVLALTRAGDREANTEANAGVSSEGTEEAPTWTPEALDAFISGTSLAGS